MCSVIQGCISSLKTGFHLFQVERHRAIKSPPWLSSRTCKVAQKLKGKSNDFIYFTNMLSNSESPYQSPTLPTVLSWPKSSAALGAKHFTSEQETSSKFLFSLLLSCPQFWGGMKLHTRDSESLFPSEHRAFTVSKQIWRVVLPHVRSGSWAEKELGESRTMPGSLKKTIKGQKKRQKTWSPPYFEDTVFSSKA